MGSPAKAQPLGSAADFGSLYDLEQEMKLNEEVVKDSAVFINTENGVKAAKVGLSLPDSAYTYHDFAEILYAGEDGTPDPRFPKIQLCAYC